MLGYWLICNGLISYLLTSIWMLVVVIGVFEQDNFKSTPSVTLPYGLCNLLRVLLLCLVWRERQNFPGARKIADEQGRRCMFQVENQKERQVALDYRGRFYSRALAKDMYQGKNLQLKLYHGQSIMADCECVASKVNLQEHHLNYR